MAREVILTNDPDRETRFNHLVDLAKELFEGNEAEARRWLSEPAYALGGEKPIRLAETESGARKVETLIMQLEYGVLP